MLGRSLQMLLTKPSGLRMATAMQKVNLNAMVTLQSVSSKIIKTLFLLYRDNLLREEPDEEERNQEKQLMPKLKLLKKRFKLNQHQLRKLLQLLKQLLLFLQVATGQLEIFRLLSLFQITNHQVKKIPLKVDMPMSYSLLLLNKIFSTAFMKTHNTSWLFIKNQKILSISLKMLVLEWKK